MSERASASGSGSGTSDAEAVICELALKEDDLVDVVVEEAP